MEFSFDARIPEGYIAEPSLRMEIYHRLGATNSPDEVEALLKEMNDRFGSPPTPVIWLYHLTRIRLFASAQYFSLLKFERQTLYTEKQKGKEIEKRSFQLPKFSSPQELEKGVILKLQG